MNHLHDQGMTPEELWAFYREAGQAAIRGHRIAEAVQHFSDALQVAEQFGPTDLRLADSLTDLAMLVSGLGRQLDPDADAEPLLRRALAIREQVLGPDDPAVAETLVKLATLSRPFPPHYPRYPTPFLTELERALEIHERAGAPEPTVVFTTVKQLTQLTRHPDVTPEIEALLRRAIALCERHWGREHPSLVESEVAIARLYEQKERFDEAEALLLRALAYQEAAFGPEHPSLGTILSHLVGFYRKFQRYPEAETYQRRLFPIRAAEERRGNPPSMHDLLSLGDLCALQGKFGEAEALYQEALARLDRAGGAGNWEKSRALQLYADLLRMTGRFAEALQMDMQAAEKEPRRGDHCIEAHRRVIWPPPHPDEQTEFAWIRWLVVGYVTDRSSMVRWETTAEASLYFAHRSGGGTGSSGGGRGWEQCQTLQWRRSDLSLLVHAFAVSPPGADVVVVSAVPSVPADPGGTPRLVATQTFRLLGRPDFAEGEVRFSNEGEGDLLRLRLDSVEPAPGWDLLVGARGGEALPLPLHVGRIGPGGTGLLLVRMLRRSGTSQPGLTLRGAYTDAAGSVQEL